MPKISVVIDQRGGNRLIWVAKRFVCDIGQCLVIVTNKQLNVVNRYRTGVFDMGLSLGLCYYIVSGKQKHFGGNQH